MGIELEPMALCQQYLTEEGCDILRSAEGQNLVQSTKPFTGFVRELLLQVYRSDPGLNGSRLRELSRLRANGRTLRQSGRTKW